MVLSKRWELLWTLVPKLIYDDSYQNIEYGSFSRFVDKSLLLHEAPVIEILCFKLGRRCDAADISVWTRTAVKRCVRCLIVDIDCSSSKIPFILPKSLYTGCTMLVTLKLNSVVILEVSSLVSFPSLKTLSLSSVRYPNDAFVKRLLSNCLVLEALLVERDPNDNVTIFTVIVHSLKSLFLRESPKSVKNDARGFVIDAPSLECLDIVDHKGGFCIIENDMPKIVKADVDVLYVHPGKILGSITSAKRLHLCLSTSKNAYPVGSVFHRLVHLRLCTCETEWLNLLMRILIDSPKLRELILEKYHEQPYEASLCWSEPSSIPECVISSLETLEWVKYEGTEEEKDVSTFILRNAKCLKKATISSNSNDPNKKLQMLKELSSSPRRSPTCQLIFD
ncbi:probable FBD-associated F-box protein At1g32375 isoform X2 [Capsella rubella]|nr:probable FBD-associated F-box protein At1g32375 isoform X2 [Capsella rubella]